MGPSRLKHRLATKAHRTGARLARTRLGQRIRRPMISVIVPFYGVEDYIADCLESIAVQSTSDFEVVLVDDGSPDGSRAIAEEFVARDSRFRLIVQDNGGLGAARNTGVRHARGRFLTFVDSDDALPPDALAALRDSARRTGSDIVVGAVDRFDSVEEWRPDWVRKLHKTRRERVHIEEFLPLLRNLYTWNKLYRADFWRAQGLWFREGVAYEDQPIVTQLLIAARSIDVIPEVVYRYRARDDASSISQQTATLKDLRDRVSAWRATEVALQDAPASVRDAWLETLISAHFIWYLASAGIDDDEFWSTIQEIVAEITDGLPRTLWHAAPPPHRVMVELARLDRRSDLRDFIDAGGERIADFPATPEPNGIRLALPLHDDPTLEPDLFLLRPEQLRLSQMVEVASWTDDGLLLRGRAYLGKVDIATHPSHVDVVLVGVDGGEQVFAATDGVAVTSEPLLPDGWCDYSAGTFEVTVPFAAFEATPAGRARWDLRLRVSAAGFTVEEPISSFLRAGAPGEMEPAWRPDGTRLFIDWAFRRPAHVVRMPAGPRALELSAEGRRVTGIVVAPDGATPRTLEIVSEGRVERARVTADGARARFVVEVPAGNDSWELHAWLPGGSRPARVELPDIDAALAAVAPGSAVQFARTRHGFVRIDDRGVNVHALRVETLGDRGLRIVGQVFGSDATTASVRTTSVKGGSTGAAVPIVEGRFEAEVDLHHEVHRFGRLPLGIGEHQLVVELSGGAAPAATVPFSIAPQLRRRLPIAFASSRQEGMVVRGGRGTLQLNLVRPIGEMAGQFRQQRAQRRIRAVGRASTRGLLLRSYFGERATDSGVAIQEELRRRGSDLPVFWAVQDHSTPVPEGGIPVVINTERWFDLLGSATYYVDNMFQPEYHHKPEGQVIVETFHGYPFKLMGHQLWRHQGFERALIASYEKRATEWDYLLSPAPYATPLLTRDFGYDGPVLEIGYPRNDVLQSDQAGPIRQAVRASLGIRDDQTVVLYAPTFRDYLARNNNQATMSDFFDFAAVQRAFGDDVVVLMRGHAFNARASGRIGRLPGVIDVTDYPEINDLYLAADVGVVDYSSLRFDFAITGKPMIFLVPDIERYVEARGWLMDFGPTAPGPHVMTTEDVIEQLRDLPGLVARHREAYDAFRTAYLPLEDGHAAARFVDAVMVPRGDA